MGLIILILMLKSPKDTDETLEKYFEKWWEENE